MSRFSEIAKGARQIDEVELPLPGIETPVKVGLRVLLSNDDDAILKSARDHAISAGVSDPKDGNPIYDVALARATIALACVDLASPDKKTPFFESADEVRTGLDRDRIGLLFARQQLWQDRCSPSSREMGSEQFIAKVLEIAGAEDDERRPFDSMRPALHESFTRSLARQYVALLTRKSPSGSDTDPDAESSSRSPDA